MIDIHNHVFVGVDDGPRNKAEMVALIKQAKTEGVTGIVITPHHLHPRFSNSFDKVETLLKELQADEEIKALGIDFYPGQEIRITDTIFTDLESKAIKGINYSKYLLIELPTSEVPAYTKKLLYELQTMGFIPIIAHPERNRAIAEDINLLYELISNGSLSQLTAASLVGHSGKSVQQLALQIMDANLAHFIASDAHHAERRPFLAQSLFQEKKLAERREVIAEMMQNAEQLVLDKDIIKHIPVQNKRKKRFFGLF